MKEKTDKTSINEAELNNMMHIVCENCDKTFVATSDEIHHKEKFTVVKNAKVYHIYLTYYDCPFCRKRHFVQIDDDKSLSMLRQQKDLFVRLYKSKTKNESVNKKDKNKFEKAQKSLSSYRLSLMKKFSGLKTTSEDTGLCYDLRFSV